MSDMDALLRSYLDLARHLDPLQHPDEAPADVAARLGRFDVPWLTAQLAALRSIANAIEDLEDLASRDDEVDRTMLLDTVRGDIARLHALIEGESADPVLPLRHAVAALDALLGEDFDAGRAAALAARLGELPEMLSLVREELRPAPAFLVAAASLALAELDERLDLAAERLEDTTVVTAAREALDAHSSWLLDGNRVGGEMGLGEEAVLARLALLNNEPLGLKGTLRTLELRRAGAERALLTAAADLGYPEDWPAALEALPELSPLDPFERLDGWLDEWERAGSVYITLGLAVPDAEPGPAPAVEDRATLAVWAMRARARAMFEAARAQQERPVRRLLVAPGVRRGWSRAVVALLRHTTLLDAPEHLLAAAWLALLDAVAAETDLLLAARMATPEELVARTAEITHLDEERARALVVMVAEEPLAALAAGLSHEGWVAWHADEGGEPATFLHRALEAGGLAVPLARWVLTADDELDEVP
ncbi:MAG TPA: hypothetical protein PLI93_06820, partial [Gemmatimonadales bacterium]|nr:hypothetical protein [Gemmatimonadales bacterium]